MVLGIVAGSMPMLVSLLLMQGITLTMWRSFLDKAIPQYNSERWRKNFLQGVNNNHDNNGDLSTTSLTSQGISATSSITESIATSSLPIHQSPSSSSSSLRSTAEPLSANPYPTVSAPQLPTPPPLVSTFDHPQTDPVTNSLQILANMDPKLIQLLSQLQNQNMIDSNSQNSVSSATTQLNALNALTSLLQSLPNPSGGSSADQKLTELLNLNIKNQLSPVQQKQPYMQYTQIDQNDPIKYYEVSSDRLKLDLNSDKDSIDDYDQQSNISDDTEKEIEDPDHVKYEYVNIGDSGSSKRRNKIGSDKDLYEEVDYDNDTDQEQNEQDAGDEDSEEEDYEIDEDQNEKPKITIRQRIKSGNIFAASKNKMRFLKPKLPKKSIMFGKPRIQKRMLRFDLNPFQYAQTQLKRKFFDSFRSIPLFRRNSKNPKKIQTSSSSSTPTFDPSWKRSGNPSKGNFRFVTPKVPILLPVGNHTDNNNDNNTHDMTEVSKNAKNSKTTKKNSTKKEITKAVSKPKTISNQKKNLRLKSKKITLVDIDEVQNNNNCTNTIIGKNGKPFKEIWSKKNGWNDCHPKSPNFRISKGIIVPNLIDTTFNSSSTTMQPTEEEDEEDYTTTTDFMIDNEDQPVATPETIMETTTTVPPVSFTEIATTTTIAPAIPDSLLINFNNFLMSLTTTSPMSTSIPSTTSTTTTTTISPLITTTTQRNYVDELPKEFLLHILNVINSSKIDNFQINDPDSFQQQHQQPKENTKKEITEQNIEEEMEDSKNNDDEDEDDDHEDEFDEQLEDLHKIIKEDNNRVDGKIFVAHRFKRVCYFLLNGGRDGQLDISQLELHICSHLIVGYARISTNGLVVTQKPLEDTEKYQRLTLMKLQYPKLKVLLSIGDLGGAMFSIVASSNRTRERFIMSILDICDEFNFDGVDIDWEFPGFHTPGSVRDKQNLILLLKELRSKSNQYWKRISMKSRGSFLISVAVGAPLMIASTSYTIPDIGKYVDFVNLMSYDFHYYRPDKPYTGHHSPLYPRSSDNAYFSTLNVAWTATYWANSGMPLQKIIVGVPTYARTYNLVVPIGQNMINVPASGPGLGKGKLNYTLVCEFLKQPGAMKQYDFHSQVPYAYRGFDWIAYENEMSVAIKAQWVIKTGMGGIVTFALNFDDSKGTCREDGKKFPLQKTISNLLELASIKSFKQSIHVTKIRGNL